MPFGISLGGAALIAGGVGAAGSLATGIMQSQNASDAQDKAQGLYAQQRTDTAPWRTTGAQALPATADLLGLNGPDAAARAMGNFQTSPGYQFQLEQGLRAIDAGAAAQGMLRSGATLKEEQKFGSDLANLDFSNYYNRLFGLSKLGSDVATGGATNASNAANTAIGGANAQNSILGNTMQGLTSQANTLLNNPNVQKTLGIGSGAAQPAYNPAGVNYGTNAASYPPNQWY
jgi:hypothetical protein